MAKKKVKRLSREEAMGAMRNGRRCRPPGFPAGTWFRGEGVTSMRRNDGVLYYVSNFADESFDQGWVLLRRNGVELRRAVAEQQERADVLQQLIEQQDTMLDTLRKENDSLRADLEHSRVTERNTEASYHSMCEANREAQRLAREASHAHQRRHLQLQQVQEQLQELERQSTFKPGDKVVIRPQAFGTSGPETWGHTATIGRIGAYLTGENTSFLEWVALEDLEYHADQVPVVERIWLPCTADAARAHHAAGARVCWSAWKGYLEGGQARNGLPDAHNALAHLAMSSAQAGWRWQRA